MGWLVRELSRAVRDCQGLSPKKGGFRTQASLPCPPAAPRWDCSTLIKAGKVQETLKAGVEFLEALEALEPHSPSAPGYRQNPGARG